MKHTQTQTHTCLASFALSRAMVAVSSARAAAMLLLARLVFKALISRLSVLRRATASLRFISPSDVSDSICVEWVKEVVLSELKLTLSNWDNCHYPLCASNFSKHVDQLAYVLVPEISRMKKKPNKKTILIYGYVFYNH